MGKKKEVEQVEQVEQVEVKGIKESTAVFGAIEDGVPYVPGARGLRESVWKEALLPLLPGQSMLITGTGFATVVAAVARTQKKFRVAQEIESKRTGQEYQPVAYKVRKEGTDGAVRVWRTV